MRYILLFILSGIFVFFLRGNYPLENAEDLYSDVAKTESIIHSYDSLLTSVDLEFKAFELAFSAFQTLLNEKRLLNDSLLTIIDYSKPSDKERLYVIDMKNLVLVEKSLVAHGQNSGIITADKFSNRKQSHMSSLGLFLTSDTYYGRHGYSLRIEGLEAGKNDNAKIRAIVFHGAHYVSQSYINENGRLGRSFGCPALPYNKTDHIIDLIKGGSCVYIYHPSEHPDRI